MYQLRTYTIADPEAAEIYFRIHWQRHIASLESFGIHTESVFKEVGSEGNTRVIALVRYDEGADAEALNHAYMESEAFRADMAGFDFRKMVKVETVDLIRSETI